MAVKKYSHGDHMAQLGKITGLYEASHKLNEQIQKEQIVLKRIQQRELLEKIKGDDTIKNAKK
tara:strand:+ start:723 stop:911 length:189 start_codon:yes stop_codon:yes gene_type:complete